MYNIGSKRKNKLNAKSKDLCDVFFKYSATES